VRRLLSEFETIVHTGKFGAHFQSPWPWK